MAEKERMLLLLFVLDQKPHCGGGFGSHLPKLRRIGYAATVHIVIKISIIIETLITRTWTFQRGKPTVKQDESRNVSGKDTGVLLLMFLRSPTSGAMIPMLFINPPQHETSCCAAELNWRYAAGLIMSDDGIPMVGKLWAHAGNTCWGIKWQYKTMSATKRKNGFDHAFGYNLT